MIWPPRGGRYFLATGNKESELSRWFNNKKRNGALQHGPLSCSRRDLHLFCAARRIFSQGMRAVYTSIPSTEQCSGFNSSNPFEVFASSSRNVRTTMHG